ncbi:MAG: class I lanthipeptide [Acidobacteriota bacterium]|nr:class I lanthipeptide [Acidobacteriota bacterium]
MKKSVRPLQLNRETLRELNPAHIAEAAGGQWLDTLHGACTDTKYCTGPGCIN